jgi:hypothetical protein
MQNEIIRRYVENLDIDPDEINVENQVVLEFEDKNLHIELHEGNCLHIIVQFMKKFDGNIKNLLNFFNYERSFDYSIRLGINEEQNIMLHTVIDEEMIDVESIMECHNYLLEISEQLFEK